MSWSNVWEIDKIFAILFEKYIKIYQVIKISLILKLKSPPSLFKYHNELQYHIFPFTSLSSKKSQCSIKKKRTPELITIAEKPSYRNEHIVENKIFVILSIYWLQIEREWELLLWLTVNSVYRLPYTVLVMSLIWWSKYIP